jgi:hypothetical protein
MKLRKNIKTESVGARTNGQDAAAWGMWEPWGTHWLYGPWWSIHERPIESAVLFSCCCLHIWKTWGINKQNKRLKPDGGFWVVMKHHRCTTRKKDSGSMSESATPGHRRKRWRVYSSHTKRWIQDDSRCGMLRCPAGKKQSDVLLQFI